MIASVLIVYLAIIFAIALWSRGEARSLEGYYLAGRRLPYWVAAFSTNATGESGWLLLGLSGMGYLLGVHALWIVVGETLGVWLGWRLVARRLKVAADRSGSITVPDFLDDALKGSGSKLRIAAVFIILSMVAAYVTAQMMATGKVFSSFLPLQYSSGVLLGGAITLAYTAYGGFKAVAYSDVLQGVLMLLALTVLPIAGWLAIQGPFWESLEAADPALLDPTGGMGLGPEGLIAIASFIFLGFAFMGAPQLLTRFMAIRDPAEIGSASRIAVLCIILFDLGAVFTGLTGRILFPDLADVETVLPSMARGLFPPIVTGLFMVMVLAAIMSTVDSLLILASSAVVRDLMQKVLRIDWPDRTLTSFGKAVTAAIGIGAIAVALMEAKLVFWAVVFAQSGLASAFGPPVICALFYRRTTRTGALAGMVAGFSTNAIWAMFLKPYTNDTIEIIPGLLAGFGATLLVSHADSRKLRRSED